MKKIFIYVLLLLVGATACDDFLNPEQGLVLSEDNIPADEVEMRSISLGLYSLQQDLVEQIVMLGELRADLLTVTPNADPDLIEINSHQITEANRYASPARFYKLIAACNKVVRILENTHPEVVDPSSVITNYHRMYGEAIAMRSWSYFNAVRIYNEIPYIPETLNSIEEINAFVNSPGTYTDSIYIDYSPLGAIDTDTIFDTTFVYTEKKFLNQDQIVRQCISDIDDKIQIVGVDYSNMDDIDDETWNVTVWNEDALQALKVQLYMHLNNYVDAMEILNETFINASKENDDDANTPYAIDDKFEKSKWKNMFTSIDGDEHIFTLQFQKTSASWQLNNLQSYFSILSPNTYAVKPTSKSVTLWESQWVGKVIDVSTPTNAYTVEPGTPGDFYRGYGSSYNYFKDGIALSAKEVEDMLALKVLGYWDEVEDIMRGVDTVAYKYTIGKGVFDKDANFTIYRAAGMHLYMSEAEANNQYIADGITRNGLLPCEKYIYGDPNNTSRLGTSGRVGFTDKSGITLDNTYYYEFDPNNNEIIGYERFADDLAKLLYVEDIIMNERARELAFEGERFYDYIRIARRRNLTGNSGTEWLANSISESYPADQRDDIKTKLMNESNWYLPFILK